MYSLRNTISKALDSLKTHFTQNISTSLQQDWVPNIDAIEDISKGQSMTGVYTRSYNSQRTGANLNETILTQASLKSKGIKQLFSFFFEGDARGTEGAMLIAPAITADDGKVHDIAFVATMANDVYGYDANTGTLLWQRRIGNPVSGTRVMDMYLINDHWGILSTPVIDPTTNIGYVVAMISPTGLIVDSTHWLHAINLVDGSEAAPPLDLSLASYKASTGRLSVMGNVPRKQRCGLLLDDRNGHKTVFVANGSFNEDANTNQGWLIACDVTHIPFIATAWTTTNRYSGGGLWMGGQGPSLDPVTGDILLAAGNGSFDAVTDFGESVIRLAYTQPRATTSAKITVKTWFTPYTDTGRVAGANYQTLADTSLLPAALNRPDAPPAATSNMDSASDEDLNSGGPLLILAAVSGLSLDIIVQAGKDGIIYIMNAETMGNPVLTDFAPNVFLKNVIGGLLSPPVWFTYYNPANPAPTDFSQMPTTYNGYTHHQHSTPVFFLSSIHGPMLFTWGENGNLRAWRINSNFTLTYLACSAEMASPNSGPPGGMPGGMLSLSANGSVAGSAILWACVPYGNANQSITQGRFLAYDAENFGTYANGSKQLVPLWDSRTWGINYTHNKFNIPHVWNGKIYVPTYSDQVMVFG